MWAAYSHPPVQHLLAGLPVLVVADVDAAVAREPREAVLVALADGARLPVAVAAVDPEADDRGLDREVLAEVVLHEHHAGGGVAQAQPAVRHPAEVLLLADRAADRRGDVHVVAVAGDAVEVDVDLLDAADEQVPVVTE